MKRLYILSALVSGLLPGCSQAGVLPVFQLDPPSGILFAQPGQTVGWGFSLTSDTYYFLNTTLATVSIADGASLGVFTDFLSPYLNASGGLFLGPASAYEPVSVSRTFDPLAQTGAGSFSVPLSTPSGSVIRGTISLRYQLTIQDPNDPATTTLDYVTYGGVQLTDAELSAPFEVRVVPEPGTLWMGAALVLLVLARRRKRC